MFNKSNVTLSSILVIFILFLIPSVLSSVDNCGDVDNSGGEPDISDITRLIDYLYLSHRPLDCGTVTDIDGNIYQTVKIGDQEWMLENLKVTHYRNGDPIPNVSDSGTWDNLSTGAYCDYNNDVNNVAAYGRLYNWYAVDDSRNLAPEGWHVPTDEEWKQLEMYLGLSQAEADAIGFRGTDEGGKLKESGTFYWQTPNTGATNESDFTAMPGGCRGENAIHWGIGDYALFWTSTEHTISSLGWRRYLKYNESRIFRSNFGKQSGLSVRCVKD
jgi:uncharacterized protein (TIGR02145 family)